MEKCFGYFGLKSDEGGGGGLSSSLGLNDEHIQLQEIEDIETTMPDARIVMIEPNPMDMRSLRGALSSKTRNTAFDLITQVECGTEPENNNVNAFPVTYHIVMPPFYPTLEPADITVTCEQLPPKVLHDLNVRLELFIRANSGAQRFILDSVDWVEGRIKRSLGTPEAEFAELDSELALR